MANIDIEKKTSSGFPWLWATLGALLVAGIILFFVLNNDDDEMEQTAEFTETSEPAEVAEVDEPEAQALDSFPVAAILANPGTWDDRAVNGDVTVGNVPTDRGFWVENDGAQAFMLIDPRGEESVVHIQQGQRLRISSASVHPSSEVGSVGELDDESRQIIGGQTAFLVVDASDLQIL